MTLREFFQMLTDNPSIVMAFVLLIPFAALLAGWLGQGEGHLSPWKYLYTTMIYLICIPGIFAITLSIYLFLFERQSIFDTNLYTQVLPVLSMLLTLWLIQRNVDLDRVPGFDKMSGLVLMIGALLSFMWIADRTRLLIFSYWPFHYVLLLFVGLLLLMRFGWSRMFAS